MRILLLRHGEPDYEKDSLTEKGKHEAELLSRRLEKYDIRDVYVSPLGRARETAEYTLKRLGLKAVCLPWLPEFRARIPASGITGGTSLPWDWPQDQWPGQPGVLDSEGWADIPAYNGGNVREIWEETKHGADALMAGYGFFKNGPVWQCENNTTITIAVFSHFAVQMAFAAYLCDISPMLLWQRTLCLPSSLTELVTEEREKGKVAFRITRLGDCTHLEENGEYRSMAGLFPECYNGIDSTDWKVNGMENIRKY